MKLILVILGVLLFSMPTLLHADDISELRAEILGEQAGKAIAVDHSEYQPEKAKEECKATFHKLWEEHFKEQGFTTDECVVNSFIKGCMKKYDEKFGK